MRTGFSTTFDAVVSACSVVSKFGRKMNQPLVSIAIVTYNQVEFIGECIESCLAQGYQNFEIVIADDGSKDGTIDVLKSFYSRFPGKITVCLSAENAGITENHNRALRGCRGKYISWLGGDDLMLPDKISAQVALMEEDPECAICYHDLEVFDTSTGRRYSNFNAGLKIDGDIRAVIRYGTFNGASSTMVRRDSVPPGGFDESLKTASDWLFWIETLSSGGTIRYIDRPLGRYRRHQGNSTRQSKRVTPGELDHLRTCQILIARYPHYFCDIIYSYGGKLFELRKKLPYARAVFASFLLRPSARAVAALTLYSASLGKLKV